MVTPSVYKNVKFTCIVYVIYIKDFNDDEAISYARKDLHRLLAEEELRHLSVLTIVLNIDYGKLKQTQS